MKTRHVFAAFLAALSCSLAASAETEKSSQQLFQVFSDSMQTVPRAGEPYFIYLDGKLVEANVTDSSGAVVTHYRRENTVQEFVMRLFQFGLYSIRFDAKGQQAVDRVAPWSFDNDPGASCTPKADCVGEGFYWIQLIGADTDFEDEPYSLTVGTQTYQGKVAKGGYVFLERDDPPETSEPMVLRLCSGPELAVSVGTDLWHSSAQPLKPSTREPEGCNKSRLAIYREQNPSLNQGHPYAFSMWARGKTPAEVARLKQTEEQNLQDAYHRLARANNDALSWLGAPPDPWNDDLYESRVRALLQRINADVARLSKANLEGFKCKPPAKVGPTPNMDAVNNYIAGFPDSVNDPELLGPLFTAAAKGNWLAVAQVYALMSQRAPDGDHKLHKFRVLQLAEWMQKRKIGAIYALVGYELSASGYYGDMPDHGPTAFSLYAALHASYPTQWEVGQSLERQEASGKLHKVGIAMQQCAKAALPGYANLLK